VGLALAALGVVAAVAEAQKPPTYPVGLDLVNVTATVHDAQGGLVADLTADDFTVLEDDREQRVELFAPAATPEERAELALNLGMLFDTSESMRRDLKLSQESAVRFLEAIPRAKDLLLVFFDRDIRISRYNSENQQGIFSRILETEGSGYTALRDAIAVYVSRVSGTPGRKVLVLFTDGDDTSSQTAITDCSRLVRSSEVVVYPVAFPGSGRPNSSDALRARAFLSELATSTGGQVFTPSASKQLAAIYKTILDELGSQYVLGYQSDNPARDGRFRRITVKLRQPELKVRHRKGYDMPKGDPKQRADQR
jgi:Ca-activated chloride channel family protein